MPKSLQFASASNRKTKRLRIDSDEDEEEHNYEERPSPEPAQSKKKSVRQSPPQPIRLKRPRLDSRKSTTDIIASTSSAKAPLNGKRAREKDGEREDQNDYQENYQNVGEEEHGREHAGDGHGRQRTSRSRSRSQSQSPSVRSSSSLTPIPTSLLGPSSNYAPPFGSSPLSEPDEPPSTAADEDHSPMLSHRKLPPKSRYMAGDKDNMASSNTTATGTGGGKKKKVQNTGSAPVKNKKRTRPVYSDDEDDQGAKEEEYYHMEDAQTEEEEEEEEAKLSDEYEDEDEDAERSRPIKGTTKGKGKTGKGLTAGGKVGKGVGKGASKEKEKEKDTNVTAILKKAKFEGPSLDNKDSTTASTAKSTKRSLAETAAKKSHIGPEDSFIVDVVGDSGAPSASPAVHNTEPKDEPGPGPPPAKKRKLPTIKKLKNPPVPSTSGAVTGTTAGTGSTNTPTTTKPTGSTADSSNADMNKLGIPEVKLNARPKTVATADLDLMNASVYAELFKTPGGAAMRASSNRRLKEEERRKELDKLRNEYKAKLIEDAKASFDLQRPAEKIARFEEQLRSWRSTALYPNFLAAKWRELWEREKRNADKWEKERQPGQQQQATSHDHGQNGIREDDAGAQGEGKEEGEM